MTSTQRPRPPRRAAQPEPPAMLGVILVVVAFALGAILLVKGGGIGFDNDSKDVKIGTGTNKDSPTKDTTTTTSSIPTTSVPAAELKIAVLNGAGKNGFAAAGVDFLSVAGYPNATAGNSGAQVQTTSVYFATGFEADARAVAALLSIAEVKPIPTTPLGKSASDVGDGTAVVVVLGSDVEGIISPPKTDNTTTTAGTGTAGTAGTGTAGSGTSGSGTSGTGN